MEMHHLCHRRVAGSRNFNSHRQSIICRVPVLKHEMSHFINMLCMRRSLGMSRSLRHTPILQNCCCRSEKDSKRQWHKRFRIKERINLSQSFSLEDFIPVHFRDVSNPYEMEKDGKTYYGRNIEKKWMRK